MPRLARILLLAALGALAVPAAGVGIAERAAFADEREIAVGTELQALVDVTLHRAEIAKGSRVSVTQVARRDGHVDAVSVALADGHVVKVPVALVHASFRVVD